MAKEKRRTEEKENPPPPPEKPEQKNEMVAHGVHRAEGGWQAFRVTEAGLEVLTPARNGRRVESQPAAVARMTEAQKLHLTQLISGRL